MHDLVVRASVGEPGFDSFIQSFTASQLLYVNNKGKVWRASWQVHLLEQGT